MFPIGWQSYPMGGKVAPVYGITLTIWTHYLRLAANKYKANKYQVYIQPD